MPIVLSGTPRGSVPCNGPQQREDVPCESELLFGLPALATIVKQPLWSSLSQEHPMAATLTCPDILELLRRHTLLEPAQLEELARLCLPGSIPQTLGKLIL